MGSHQPTATRYLGGNEYIDHVLEEHETWWIVQGHNGRLPVEAGTEEEAIATYFNRTHKWSETKSDTAA